MSRGWVWLVLLVTVVGLGLAAGLGSTPAAAGNNQAPLVDAGLDQMVAQGSPVYLDAGGARDPDGDLVAYNWTITRPNGTTATPACQSCQQTRFTPAQTGEYAVRLTATDDSGASRNDTLYVDVVTPSRPSVQILGPVLVTPETPTNYTVVMRADGVDLRRLAWSRNGSHQFDRPVSGHNATANVTRSFTDPGRYRLRATVWNEIGYSQSTTLTVRVGDRNAGTSDVCPNGQPVHNDKNGHLSSCRQSAIETTNDMLLAVPNANPNNVVFESLDGVRYRMSHDRLINRHDVNPGKELIPQDVIERDENRMDTTFDYIPSQYQSNHGGSESNDNTNGDNHDGDFDPSTGGVTRSTGDCIAPCGQGAFP